MASVIRSANLYSYYFYHVFDTNICMILRSESKKHTFYLTYYISPYIFPLQQYLPAKIFKNSHLSINIYIVLPKYFFIFTVFGRVIIIKETVKVTEVFSSFICLNSVLSNPVYKFIIALLTSVQVLWVYIQVTDIRI